MHSANKESSRKEYNRISKMTSNEKIKPPMEGTKTMLTAQWQISGIHTLYKKKYWVCLDSADHLFLNKSRNALLMCIRGTCLGKCYF